MQPESPTIKAEDLHTISVGGFSATCDAYAIDARYEHLYFASIIGAHTSVKAIWAGLLKMPPENAFITKGAVDLPVPGNYRRCVVPHLTQGTWTTNITRLPTSRGWHAMVYTKMAEYNFERSSFLLIHRAEDDLYKLHYRFLDKRISLPIHHSWARWLWKRAIDCEEAVRLEAHGIAAFWCNPDEDELRLDLAAAVSSGELEITE